MKEVKILSAKINAVSKDEFIKILGEYLSGNKQVSIAKINTEFLLRAEENETFATALDNFDLRIADGSGVLWAAKYLSLPMTTLPILRSIQAWWQAKYTLFLFMANPKYCCEPIPERFPGVEALYLMLQAADKEKAGVYFFGAEKDVLESAVKEIRKILPSLKVVGSHDGYGFQDEEVINDINEKKPKLLIVALGSPKQEYWIRDNLDKLPSVRVSVGEGGSLDFISGVHKRAPKWMRTYGLEWFWRIFMNKDKTGNSRIVRVWRAVPVFIYTIVKGKINEK